MPGAVMLMGQAGRRKRGGSALATGYTRESLLAERSGYGRDVGNTAAGGDAMAYTEHRVTNSADSGAGSLRDALSAPNRWITFAPNLGEIRLLSDSPYRENLIVDGRGAATMHVSNYGFINPGGTTPRGNVAVSDITFDYRTWWAGNSPPVAATNGPGGFISGWPAPGANDYWMHHLTVLSNGPNAEKTAGFDDDSINLSSGSDGATRTGAQRMTVDWCRFVTNYKTSVIGNTDTDPVDLVTFHHNYFDRVYMRQPLIKGARVHAYNNWHYDWGNSGIQVAGNGRLICDNSIFTAVTRAANGIYDNPGTTTTIIRHAGNLLEAANALPAEKGTRWTIDYSFTMDTAGQALKDALTADAGARG